MNPDGVPLPQPIEQSKDDPQALRAEIMKLSRQLQAERQAAAQTLASERAKWKTEMDKLRQATYYHVKDIENQNSALLQSLGRMKAENDELQKTIMRLEIRGTQEIPRVTAEPTSTVPVTPTSPLLSGEAIPQKQG